MTEHIAYIGLGSNLGDKNENLQNALSELRVHSSVLSIESSSFYDTKPLGRMDQPLFLNAVAKIKTTLSYRSLFEHLQQIELAMGRQRNEHWAPRPIDLDLSLYGEQIVDEPDLKIPHPQMHLRSFVLKGMCELDADFVHPQLDCTMRKLYQRLNGADFFSDPQKPQLISIAGNIGVGKTTLATGLAERLNAKFISEKYDDNPYLSEVYAGKTEFALDSELFFLSSSASQLRKDHMRGGRSYVNDYAFEKAHVYASGWLEPGDLADYEKHFDSICEDVVSPVLVIYMNDSVEHCLERIHQRNRPYEQQIEMPFLEHLARGYDALYTDYTVCPVMRLGSEECRMAEQVDRIAEEVKHYIVESPE